MLTKLFCVTFLGIAGSASAASQPTLEHSAPFLGHTLKIEVDAAPPSQAVVLLYSPRAGHTPTPFGLFELQRTTSQRIALGTTDALGHATFSIPIPANAAIAEKEAHFQALVDDPTATEGKVFSEGVHVRLLGTRMYTGLEGSQIDIVSAIREESVRRITIDATLATNWSAGNAVFRSNQSVGAVMSSGFALIRFDPFFGALLGPVQFGPCSTTLLTDVDEKRVFVLENVGRITAVDLASGAILGQLMLPNPSSGVWCSNSRRTEAYVGEYAGPQLTPALRRIDLSSLSDLGAFPVAGGDPQQSIACIVFASKTVFVTSRQPPVFQVSGSRGALTRIDLSTSVVTTQFVEGVEFEKALPVPSVDKLAMVANHTQQSGPPNLTYYLAPLSHSAPLVDAGSVHEPGHGSFMFSANDTEARDPMVWAVGRVDPDDGYSALGRWDLTTNTWWRVPTDGAGWNGMPPRELALVRDDFVDCVYVGIRPNPYSVPPILPNLFVRDQKTNAIRHIPLVSDPLVLQAVPVR